MFAAAQSLIFKPSTAGKLFTQQRSSLSLLGLQSRRGFSTIKPRVFSNAVFMPELFPAKLTIPATKDIRYDFTCEN